MTSKQPSRPSLNIKGNGEIPWRSDREKLPSQRARGFETKPPLNTSSTIGHSDVISHSKRVVPSHDAQGSVTNEKTSENNVNVQVNKVSNIDHVSQKDIDRDAANLYPNVNFSKSSLTSQSTCESTRTLITLFTSVEKSNYIDLSDTSNLHGKARFLYDAVDRPYFSAFSSEQLIKLALPDIVNLVTPLISSRILVSWSPEPVQDLHIDQLPHIPDELSTRRLRNEIDTLTSEETMEIKSISMTLFSHTIRVPPAALRYWLDIHNASEKLSFFRDAYKWLWENLRFNDSIIKYFMKTLLSTPLAGYPLASQSATTASLVSLMSTNWISETIMECGLDYLKTTYPNLRAKVMFQPPFFWQSCQKTWEQKRLYPSLQVFLSDFNEVRESMQTLYFPVCSSGHWFLGIVSFQKKQISIADSLKADPPSNFYETIQYFLVTFLKIDVTDWRKNWVRESCPRQKDGHSCGVVVLSLLDYLCSEGDSDSWCPDMAMQFRVLWLRRLIEHDNQAMRCLLDLHLTNSKSPRPSDHGDSSGSSDDIGGTQNPEPPTSDDESDSPTSPADTINTTRVRAIRSRKQDPLPYDIPAPGTVDSKCPLCGPPFQVFETIQGMEVCSFECVKRYIDLVLAHPRGFTVKHSKTEPSDGTFGREDTKYRKLSLRCEYSRKPESKKKQNLVPEAQRNRLSKRTACQWKVNISWPPSRPTPYISCVVSKHSGHEDYTKIQKKFLGKITPEQMAFVEALAIIPRTSRTYILEVLTKVYPEAFFNPIQVANVMDQARNDHRKHIIANGGEAMSLLQKLNDLKASDDNWVYYPDFKSSTSTDGNSVHELTRIFWMSPYQREMGKRYGDVLQVDVSEGRNVYNFYLTTFVLVDGENKSRNLAYCLHDRQDAPTFEWMFRRLDLYLNSECKFTAIFSDRDSALIEAVQKVWPQVFHGHCLWHLLRNIAMNLRPLLQGEFNKFMADFWSVYRVGSPPMFVEKWGILLRNWPIAAPYLSKNIFPDRDTFAWPWVGVRFLAGLRTTGRVESEHKTYKLIGLCSSSTFTEVFEMLNNRTNQQKDSAEWQEYKASQTKHQIGGDLKRFFGPIVRECMRFLTCFAYHEIHLELTSALNIRTIREVPQAEYERIYAIERISHEVFEVHPDFNPSDGRHSINELDTLQERYITLECLLDVILPDERASVVVYEVRGHDQYNASGELRPVRSRFVAIRQNNFEVCTCLKGRHGGITCRHFFAVIKEYPAKHPFNIAQLHPRWVHNDNRQNSIDRPWIYLTSPHSTDPTVASNNPNLATQRAAPSTPHRGTMEPFDDRVVTPRQNSKKKANSYGNTLEGVKHFLKINNSQDAADEFLKHVQAQIAETHNRNRQANPFPDGPLRMIDPPKNSANGRKKNARIKGKDETQKSSKKQRKM